MMTPVSDHGTATLHVLTVHFNTPEITAHLVQTFPRLSAQGRDVIIHVLDNASTPENLNKLTDSIAGIPHVTLTVSDRNLGFGEGVNRLFESYVPHDSDIIWILNPDTRLDEGCLEALEAQLDLSGDYAIISPLIYSGSGRELRIWYCGGFLNTQTLRVQHRQYGEPVINAPPHPFQTDFVTGAAPMMFASTFRNVGGFPHGYFLYWEDVHFSWRARSMGLRLGVVPTARLWHAVGASSGYGQSATYYYWFARNRFRFAVDIGVRRHRLLLGRGFLETMRPVAKSVLEEHGRFSKFRATIRGSMQGLTDASSPRR